MVVDKNQGGGIMFDSTLDNLAGRHRATIYRAFREVNGVNNLVLAVKVDNNNLVNRVIHGLKLNVKISIINNFLGYMGQ